MKRLTTPRGYWTDKFHAPLEKSAVSKRVDFSLLPKSQPDRFDFVFMSDLADLATGPGKVGTPKTKASIRETNSFTVGD